VCNTEGADPGRAVVWGVAVDAVWEGMQEAGYRNTASEFSTGQGTG
ncbi:unnamed protein product, partial [marine sediment metagenome]